VGGQAREGTGRDRNNYTIIASELRVSTKTLGIIIILLAINI
jgi:hypothetical protein